MNGDNGEKLDLKDIVQSLKKKDNTCLKQFFLAYGEYCTSNLIRKTNCSKEDADDIFVDAILNFRDKILNDKIEYLTNVRSYLYSTCYNMWLVKYRKQRVHDAHVDNIKSFYEEPVLNNMKKEELFQMAEKAINALGEKCQKIIRLYYLNRLSMVEIAEELGFASAGVAKTLKSRCYKKLIEEARKQMTSKPVYIDQ